MLRRQVRVTHRHRQALVPEGHLDVAGKGVAQRVRHLTVWKVDLVALDAFPERGPGRAEDAVQRPVRLLVRESGGCVSGCSRG